MQRMFSMFPAGAAGLGLLLLRVQIAIQCFCQGYQKYAGPGIPDWLLAVLALLSLCLGVGLLTPFAALFCAIGGLLIALPAPGSGVLEILVRQLGPLALILLGPGAYAWDAKIFGQRLLADVR
jgi:hypothetical protein